MVDAPKVELFVYAARDAARAVILRKGPSKHIRMILWHTDTDQFEDGQWIKHRIYPERSAISPDGQHFYAFGFKYDLTAPDGKPFETRPRLYGGYGVISRPPYFTALVYLPQGDTYGGAGIFLDNKNIWLHQTYPHRWHLERWPVPLRAVFHPGVINRKAGYRSNMMVPDHFVYGDGNRARISPKAMRRLRQTYPLRTPRDAWYGMPLPQPPVWCATQGGKLYRVHPDGGRDLLRDFTDMTFEPVRAPYDTRPARPSESLRIDRARDVGLR